MRDILKRTLIAGLVFTAVVWSQVSTGTINVDVHDASGAVVAGANVTITHVQTGNVRQGEVGEDGRFRATFLPIGDYTVSAEKAGFKKKILSGLTLLVDQNATITVLLDPGQVHEVLEVNAETPLLETNSSSIGDVIENKKILELPLNGRNAFSLGLLAGNTTPVTGQATNLPFVGGGGRFSSNEVMLDGADNNTTANNGSIGRAGIAYTPSVDAVAEFKVQTNNFSAEFGNTAGVVINATTRSGSNELHASLFEFVRNNEFDANNFFTNAAGQPRAPFRQNQFGGALGGPIVRNHTFFFMDYEGTRRRTAASTSISDVPPAAFRTGDFSSFGAPIFDPRARTIGPSGTVISTPFPNNQVPASLLNPTSVALMNLVPLPNYGAPGAQSRNYFNQVPNRFNYDRWDARIDHNIGSHDNIFGRFSFGNQITPAPGRFGAGQWIGGGTTTLDFTRQLVVGDTHIFSPTVVNEFRFGYVRHNSTVEGVSQQGAGWSQQNKLAMFPFPLQGFPAMLFSYGGTEAGSQEFTQLGAPAGVGNFYVIENRFQWADNLNITRGKHTLKMGVDARRLRMDTLSGTPFFGEFIFGSSFTYSSNSAGSGSPFAEFMMGLPTTIQGSQMLDWGREREIYFGAYFQDDWRATSKLTLNLGYRYDLFTQPVDARDLGSMFNVSTGTFQVPGKNGFSRAIVDGDHLHFAPRGGFAYQASQKFVIRGGFGIFYGMRDRNQQTTQFSNNFPNIPQFTAPTANPNTTLLSTYTINTPIQAIHTDPTLSGYTVSSPLPGTDRTTSFQNAKFPYTEQANLSFQFSPTPTWMFEAGLSAANGKHLTSGAINPNQLPFSAALSGQNKQANRLYPNISAVIYESGSWGSSYYRAVNFKLEKRLSKGLTVVANYTISKNLEDLGSGVCTFGQGGNVLFLDPYNPSREKTYALLDVPQVFVMNYVYELPWGPGRHWLSHGSLGRILGGWSANGIATLRGGFPNDLTTNVLPPTFAAFNVPDRVPGVSMYLGKGPNGYLNPAAFRVPNTVLNVNGVPVQEYGNSARAVVRGPGSVNLDFSLAKDFRITERYRLQLRSEAFNLTNTPTFFMGGATSSALTCKGTPGSTCSNSDFGTLSTGTATGRQLQFGLKLLF